MSYLIIVAILLYVYCIQTSTPWSLVLIYNHIPRSLTHFIMTQLDPFSSTYVTSLLNTRIPLICRLNATISPNLCHHFCQVRSYLDILNQGMWERGPLLKNLVKLVSIVSCLLRFKLYVCNSNTKLVIIKMCASTYYRAAVSIFPGMVNYS